MPILYMGQCSEHKASFVPNKYSEVELFRTYKLPDESLPFIAVIHQKDKKRCKRKNTEH